jgi:hypothetical protein
MKIGGPFLDPKRKKNPKKWYLSYFVPRLDAQGAPILRDVRAVLERKIDELRIFERDYRTRLKTYLENLLADVDGKAVNAPGQGGAWDSNRADGSRPGTQLGG